MESLQVPPPPHHYSGLDIQTPGVKLHQRGYNTEVVPDPQDEDNPQVSLLVLSYTDRDTQVNWHKYSFTFASVTYMLLTAECEIQEEKDDSSDSSTPASATLTARSSPHQVTVTDEHSIVTQTGGGSRACL